jgi:hypothetical protein
MSMASATYHGVVRGGVILLDDGPPLADGTEVNVTPVANGAAIIAALDAGPPVPKEWVEELQRIIDEGQRPPMLGNIFQSPEDDEERA